MAENRGKKTQDVAGLRGILADYRGARAALERLANDFMRREQTLGSLGQDRRATNGEARPRAANGAPVLSIFCLGPFRVEMDGIPLGSAAGGKPLRVLKFLAGRSGRPLPREVLMEALWPDADPDSAANRLRVAVHALRQSLGDGADRIIAYEDGCYRLNPLGTVAVDADDFEQCWQRGLRSEREKQPEEAIEHFLLAEELYRGDFLEEDLYEEWALVRREQLKDMYLSMIARLAAAARDSGAHTGCIDYCRKLLGHDPCNEEAYRMLMASHVAIGQHARAVRWYQVCEATLREQLGLAPTAATRAVRDSLLLARGANSPQTPR